MAGSHITKFHTHEDKQPVITDLLSQENEDYNKQHDQQLLNCKDDTGQGHHNPRNRQSAASVDCKLATGKDESFSSEAVKDGDITDIMGELAIMVVFDRNTVQGFINDMVSERSHMNAPTVVEDNNKTITVSKLGEAKPVIVHGNNNGAMKLANTGLKSNNILGAHIVGKNEGWFYG